ncbi:MAG: flagellar hook-length control protein FliK [Gammaproteobacteria bacterium]
MIPVQVLARILDVPPKLEGPDKPLTGLTAVQPVLNATRRDQAAARTAFENFTVGQTLAGKVVAVDKGISMVEIAGQTVAMRLPHPASVGDTLTLRFAGHMPQAVFMLEPPAAAPTDAPKLSLTARLLSDIMQQVADRNAPPTLVPPGPLLARPVTQVGDLALALRTALVRSGLFYESHLANWAVGLDSLDGLLEEPQNRLAAGQAPAQPPAGDAAKALNPMHVLLSQQLQVLETPQFIWRGELWPGQPLEWLLRHDVDPEHAGPGADDEAASGGWTSQLKLSLPELGEVTVHIRLDPAGAFSIRVMPANPETEPLLRAHQGEFAEQMAAAGCTLQSLTVERDHGEAPDV